MFKLYAKEYGHIKDDIKRAFVSFFGDTFGPQPEGDLEEGFVSDEYDNQRFVESVKQAKEEWMAAQSYFQNVSDPDLIDYAIYSVEACRKKYVYLLKQAKIKGVKGDFMNIQ
ncbi:MAG: YaaL family protein [Clostridia bacterium]|nr:YaaL family protein [Clostridia bacterium]